MLRAQLDSRARSRCPARAAVADRGAHRARARRRRRGDRRLSRDPRGAARAICRRSRRWRGSTGRAPAAPICSTSSSGSSRSAARARSADRCGSRSSSKGSGGAIEALDRCREMLDEDPRITRARSPASSGCSTMTSSRLPRPRCSSRTSDRRRARQAGAAVGAVGRARARSARADHPPEDASPSSSRRARRPTARSTRSAARRWWRSPSPSCRSSSTGWRRAAAGSRQASASWSRCIASSAPTSSTPRSRSGSTSTVAAARTSSRDRATAREYYRSVLDTSPITPRARRAREPLPRGARVGSAVRDLARRAELAGADGERRAAREYLMSRRGSVQGAGPPDRGDARLRAGARALAPPPTDASRALEQHVQPAAHRHADLADLLEKRPRLRRRSRRGGRAARPARRASTRRTARHRVRGRQLPRRARRQSGHEGAIARARALPRRRDAQRVSAAEVLEPVYVARHDWPRLVRIYRCGSRRPTIRALRLKLTRLVARLYEEQLEDLDGAIIWYGKVFREAPADAQVRDQLGRLAGILDAWARLARIYEEWLTDGADPAGEAGAITLEILRTLAQHLSRRGSTTSRAPRAAYRRLLQIDPGDEVAFVNLEKLLTRARAASPISSRPIARRPRRRSTPIGAKAAHLQAGGDRRGAAARSRRARSSSYRAVLDLDGRRRAGARRARSAVHRRASAGTIWSSCSCAPRARRRAGLGRARAAARRGLRDGAGGLVRRRSTPMKRCSRARPASRRRCAPLERLIVDHDHTFRIAQILEPIYREQDAWQKLVVIYDAELEFIDDRPRRVELQREIARLHEQRGGDGRLGVPAAGARLERGGGGARVARGRAVRGALSAGARARDVARARVHARRGGRKKPTTPSFRRGCGRGSPRFARPSSAIRTARSKPGAR